MVIIFSNKELLVDTKTDELTERELPLPVIHQLTFCCEEMADEVIQKPCQISIGKESPSEIWFHPGNEFEHYVRCCPFCGDKIYAREGKH